MALSIGGSLESQRLVQVSSKAGAPRLDYHVGWDEFVIGAELHVMFDPVERQHQVHFIGLRLLLARLCRSLLTLAQLTPIIEIWQRVRVEAAIFEHSSRDQKFRIVNVSRVPENIVHSGKREMKFRDNLCGSWIEGICYGVEEAVWNLNVSTNIFYHDNIVIRMILYYEQISLTND